MGYKLGHTHPSFSPQAAQPSHEVSHAEPVPLRALAHRSGLRRVPIHWCLTGPMLVVGSCIGKTIVFTALRISGPCYRKPCECRKYVADLVETTKVLGRAQTKQAATRFRRTSRSRKVNSWKAPCAPNSQEPVTKCYPGSTYPHIASLSFQTQPPRTLAEVWPPTSDVEYRNPR